MAWPGDPNETRGASESTNTVAALATLVSPALLTAVTCQVWRPWERATGERISVAVVFAITTPSTLTT